jgi:hypothetical protein
LSVLGFRNNHHKCGKQEVFGRDKTKVIREDLNDFLARGSEAETLVSVKAVVGIATKVKFSKRPSFKRPQVYWRLKCNG